jgi:transposase InsO family protein
LKLSRSEYYYHKKHRTNVYKEENQKLDVDILRIYNESKRRYGAPKIQKMLEKEGKHVSIKRVGKRMRFLKIKSCIVKKYRPGISSKKVDNEGKKNLLNQEFKADEIRTKMVSDITYIYVKKHGWTYLATVEDLCSRAIIGYSYGKTMEAELVIEAIKNAQKKGNFKEGAIFHSDLGSQYTSNKVESYLKELGLLHSYSKKGYPYDNACMESFNAILKKEEVNLKEYETFEEAKLALFEFIEGWYNRKRIHSAIDYQTPYEIEKMSA